MKLGGNSKMANMLKKTVLLALAVIFVLSILQGATAASDGKFFRTLKLQGEEKAMEAVDKVLERDAESDESRLQKVKENLENVKERLQNAREQYDRARERYDEARQAYEDKRSEVAELRKDSERCTDDSEECQEKKDRLKKGVKNHLLKTSDLMERSLEKLLNRVENSNVLSDEEKESATAEIMGLQEELTVKQEEINALADNATAEELREAISDLKSLWQEVKKTQQRILASMISQKQENLIDKHKEYVNGLELRISELSDQGIDISELEDLLEKFKENLAQLEEDQQEERDLWVQLKRGQSVLDDWREAHDKVQEDLKESKEILREFLKKYRELRDHSIEDLDDDSDDGDDHSGDDAEDEEEEESDDNSDDNESDVEDDSDDGDDHSGDDAEDEEDSEDDESDDSENNETQ